MSQPHSGERGSKALMILGAGVIGGQLLDQLALRFPENRYIVVARNGRYLAQRANLTATVLAQWGLYPDIRIEAVDVSNSKLLADALEKHRPDVLFNATTPFPWWKIARLPEKLSALATKVGPGIWCALDAILPFHICEAIKQSGISTRFVNGCYPDATNSFLSDHSGAPCVGIGNIANVIPGMRIVFARSAGIHPKNVELRLVCHHFTSLNAPLPECPNGAPYALWVGMEGQEKFYEDDDGPFDALRNELPRLRGLEGQAVTVSSAATLLGVMLNGRRQILHAPGPLGLPGGYPISIETDGSVALALPNCLTIDQARRVNERGQHLDGIETVSSGLIRVTAKAAEAFEEIVSFRLDDVTWGNVDEISKRMIATLNQKYALELG